MCCLSTVLRMRYRRVVPHVLRNIKTWYTYYKAPQINKYGYSGQPVNKAVRNVSARSPAPAQLTGVHAARSRVSVGMHVVHIAEWGSQSHLQSHKLQHRLNRWPCA